MMGMVHTDGLSDDKDGDEASDDDDGVCDHDAVS